MDIKHFSEQVNICPLSDSQRGIYFECIKEPESVMYNVPILCCLPKDTDLLRFADAVKSAVKLHPVLDVRISTPNGIPSMIYTPSEEVAVEIKEVENFDVELKKFVKPFDFENDVLYRFELLKINGELKFLFDIHHIIIDGTSVKTFVSDIAKLYNGEDCRGEDLTQFDFAMAEQDIEKSEEYKNAKEFYKTKLDGADCDTSPVSDAITNDVPDLCGRIYTDSVEKFTEAQVAEFTKAHKINENALFMGAFSYTLAKFCGTNHSFFCSVHNGRMDSRLQNAMGMFVKTLPFYHDIDENMPVCEFLTNMYNDYYNTKKNAVVPFGELAEDYGVRMDICFIFQSSLFDKIKLGNGYVTTEIVDPGEMNTNMNIMMFHENGTYKAYTHYRQRMYSKELCERFTKMYFNTVAEMLKVEKLGDITLTDDEDLAEIERLNRTEAEYRCDKTVIELFREQATRTPDNICLVYCDKRYTYKQVDELTDRLARYLINCGVGREKVVGVLIPRCEYMLICSLAVLKAGGAYLPLDPTYPKDRLNLMVQDSGAVMLFYAEEFADVITDEFTGIRMSVADIPTVEDCDTALPQPKLNDLFIMLYTSGSTGLPKGVMFEHSNTLVTAEWVRKYFDINESSCVTAYASYGFDANVFDMYPAIISGAQLHIISEEIRLDFIALRKYFNENKITHTVMTTQVGRQFALMGGFETLKCISVAGEKLTPFEVPADVTVYNLYGPTESSIVTTGFKIDRYYKDIPIGTPVDNLKIYITDKAGRLLPVGCTGELWLSGPHVTRGYLNRPEKMAEAYGENPFCEDLGYERVYKTGDVVRILPDGNLQFVGRRDGQVKVRGFRIELTEVEEIIRRFDGIKDVTVAAFDEKSGGKFVAAYVVSDTAVDTEALCEFIRAEKPPYMVPAVIMQIDKIPLNQNQKVNKRALPVPKRDLGEIILPKNELQKKIYDTLCEVLGHSEFGINTNIYDAGLTSIGSVKLNVMLAEKTGVAIKLADIKKHDTVEKLERFIAESVPDEEYDILPDYPITQNQSGIFIECMANPDSTIYNIPVLIKLSDRVDIERLQQATKKAINAHSYVKTVLFTNAQGDVRAERNDEKEAEVVIKTVDAVPEQKALLRPFRLLGEPLYRAEIYKTPSGNYMFLDFHHIISDGTSEAVLLSDIDRAYAGEELKKERFSGYEAGLAEEKTRAGQAYESAKEYWKGLLSGVDCECLPKPEPESNENTAGLVRITTKNDVAKIKAFCDKNKITPNGFFNAVFGFSLSKFIGKDEATFASVYNGRNDSRLAKSVTMLARTIPVTVSINGEDKICDFVKGVQTQLINSMSNDACSFAELATEYGVNADVMFVYQGDDFVFDTLCGERAEFIEIEPESAKAPISFNVFAKDDGFEYRVEYRKDQYNESFAEAVVRGISAACDAFASVDELKDVSMLSDYAESVYEKMNDTDTQIGELMCHQMFEESAKAVPDKTAIVANGESMTFSDVNKNANKLANALIKLGVKKDNVIGMVLDRTKEILVCEMGILKSGGAFLPMLPKYPDDRIDFCLTNADSPYVITTEKIKAERAELFGDGKPYKTLTVEELTANGDEQNPNLKIDADAMAYCIYTSGSTGTPKGVMIEQRNLTNFLYTHHKLYKYYTDNCNGSALNVSSISFDMSIMEIMLPVTAKRCLVIATDDEFHNPLALQKLMLENNVEMVICTPSFMNNIVGIPEITDVIKPLKTLVLGAEPFPGALYDSLRKLVPDIQIVNGYGPTECSICCAIKEMHSSQRVTIGRPTGNMKMFVCDKFGNVLPPYCSGELVICGVGVGRGYVKLPDRNKASFFELRGYPAYHSGDFVRLTDAGEIDFSGRMDNQVKLRGFRVELDEIENVMCEFDAVGQSKVVVRNNGSEDYLVGFFTASEKVDIDALTAYMKSKLTYYMVPAVLMQLEKMPLTQNGKIDKKALPEVTKTATKKAKRRTAKKSLEQKLCEIFANVLGQEEIYADDDFFEMGGTSLSASKVTMLLMSDGIEVMYGDIFDHPTPETLAEFIESREKNVYASQRVEQKESEFEALKYNMVKYAKEVKRESLGNVLLTGAVGFLGIHVLTELLKEESGHIWCLVRHGKYESAKIRLKTMLVYYFSNGFEEELENRISIIDADITDKKLGEVLQDVPFDTVINCAACVKHFSDSNILEEINVGGIENLIDICQKRNAKLVQISTVSIPGIHTDESYENQVRMHENELFMIDSMDNKYVISKYKAELKMLDAIQNGLRGKIIRVGNLMGRHTDGEFQINLETNMFMRGIRGFAIMGKYPISHMTDPMSFSPVDCTARAVVLLAGTNDKFTAFNANSRYGFDEMKVIDACNRNGIKIVPADDESYYEEFQQKLGDDSINESLNGLAAYDIKDAHAVETDNLFTTNILYRIGFSWPLIDDAYLDRAIHSIMTLDYFDSVMEED